MKRIGVLLILFGLLLCGCQSNEQPTEYADVDDQRLPPPETAETTLHITEDNQEVAAAKAVLQAFFDGYAIADYENMKSYSTESAIERYFHDGDVFGNVTAALKSAAFVRLESEQQIVFYIQAAIEPTEGSALRGMTETGFYIRLLKEQSQWLVHEFFTGF